MRDLLAIIGACLAAYSLVPYIVDIVKKRTKPNIVSWFTWTVLSSIATAAAFVAHEPKTAGLALAYAVMTVLVVALSLKYGKAKFTLFDGFCQLGAVAGLVLWLIFNSPTIALVAVVVIDFIGVLPTLRHSWADPAEETWQSFAIGTIAEILILISLTSFNINSLLYPAYLVLADGGVAFVVIYRRKLKGISLSRHSVHETLHE